MTEEGRAAMQHLIARLMSGLDPSPEDRELLEMLREKGGVSRPTFAADGCSESHIIDSCDWAIVANAQASIGSEGERYWHYVGELDHFLIRCRRFDEAEPLLLSAHENLLRLQGEHHPSSETVRSRLVFLYDGMSRPEDAAKFRETE